MKVRSSVDGDLPAISQIHREAFGPSEGPEVVALTAALLRDERAAPLVSLVAEAEGQPVGHALFTAAQVDAPGEPPVASILAPVGVLPAFQRTGVGGLLIERGHAILAERGVDLVFVLGHPSYYPRFGYAPAGPAGLHAPHPVNPEAWMVKALSPGAVDRFSGTVVCASVLGLPEHW